MTSSSNPAGPSGGPAWDGTEATEPAVPVAARLPAEPSAKTRASASPVLNLILGLAAIVAVGGIGFAAGRMTAPVTAAGAGPGQFGAGAGQLGGGDGQAPGGFGGGAGGGGFGGSGFLGGSSVLEGTVVAVTGDSLTIQLGTGANGAPGLEMTIPLTSSTAVHTQTSASANALSSGQKVLVQLDTSAAPAGASPAPVASGQPRQVQVPAANVTIETP